MMIDQLIVTVIGLLVIIFTYWFFLMKKSKAVTVIDLVDIVVDGGYQPETITIPLGKTTTLQFTRKDPSSCLEEVVLSDFKIRQYLPLHKTVSIKLTPQRAGEFKFSCGMNMFHGKIQVR